MSNDTQEMTFAEYVRKSRELWDEYQEARSEMVDVLDRIDALNERAPAPPSIRFGCDPAIDTDRYYEIASAWNLKRLEGELAVDVDPADRQAISTWLRERGIR